MTDDYLYKQLFNDTEPKKPADKKEANSDVLNSLFDYQLPPAKKNGPDMKKKKSEDALEDYVKRMSNQNNEKYKSEARKFQAERGLPPHVVKQKRAIEASIDKSIKAKSKPSEFDIPIVKNTNKYMPNIVDPFAKSEPKPKKVNESTEIERTRDKASKMQVIKEKIERKSKPVAVGIMKPNVAPPALKTAPAGSASAKTAPSSSAARLTPSKKSEKPIAKKVARRSSSSSSSSGSSSSSESSSSE
jgi:hypothetical protein